MRRVGCVGNKFFDRVDEPTKAENIVERVETKKGFTIPASKNRFIARIWYIRGKIDAPTSRKIELYS